MARLPRLRSLRCAWCGLVFTGRRALMDHIAECPKRMGRG